jgi:hypothetical protein
MARPRRDAWRSLGRMLAAAGALTLLVGCCGTGRVEVAALNFRAIDPPAGPPPRFYTVDLDCCYWWLDDDGNVWVAMRRTQPILPFEPGGDFVFQLSLALRDPPAGSARDYLVTRRELRASAKFGPAETRFVSISGIVALYREAGDKLRGSFRLQVAREVNQMLGGWSRPERYLMQGTFMAVRDAERGWPIAEATEAYGWGREPITRSDAGETDEAITE